MKNPEFIAADLIARGIRGKNINTTPVPAGLIVVELFKLGVNAEMVDDFVLKINADQPQVTQP